MSKIYGHKGEPSDITIEPCVGGGKVLDKYAAVRIDDPMVQHVFVLKPEQVRAKIRRIREHSDNEVAAEEFTDRLEEAVTVAEAMDIGDDDD